MAPPKKKYGFVNRTQGLLGAVKINRKGDPAGVPVGPGDRIFLTNEEIELTEQSHARAEDSPFLKREIVHYDPATGDEIARFEAPPLEREKQPETAAA